MKNKKILALTLAAIIASGSVSQMAMQVYADDESPIAESSSTVESSPALLVEKLNMSPTFEKKLGEALNYVNEDNLYRSTRTQLVFAINNESEVKLVRYYGTSENIDIPQRVRIDDQEYNVASIGEYAFYKKNKLKSVNLPNSINEIAINAFCSCNNLELIELPDSITKIDRRAFLDCKKLQLKELPANITKIGEAAFYNCTILQLEKLPDNITEIGDNAFYNTNIESIYIPESVTKLGEDSFETKTIKEIKVSDTSPWNEDTKKYICGYYSNKVKLVTINTQAEKDLKIPCLLKVADVNDMKNLVSKNLVFENAENLFYDSTNQLIFKCVEDAELVLFAYYGNQEFVNVPQKFRIDNKTYNVTSIGKNAFENKENLKSVKLPDGIKEIGNNAFSSCESLESIELPNDIKIISMLAFYNCTNLKLTKLPDDVTEIGDGAFWYCKNLQLTELPDGVNKIGDGAFSDCTNLELNKIPNNVTEIGDFAFYNTKIEHIYMPASVVKLGKQSFETQTLKEIIAPPNSIWNEDIKNFVCNRYSNQVQLLKIPYLSKITDKNAKNLFVDSTNQIIFERVGLAELVLDSYYGNQEFVDVPQKFCIDTQKYNVISIDKYAFQNKKSLKFVNLPQSVTTIGFCAFRNCINLQLTELPNSITKIGVAAFQFCENLKLTKLPDNVTEIGDAAFDQCTNLQLTELPNAITKIPDSAFFNCKKLQLTKLPDNITEIDDGAFYYCENLQLKELPNSITKIGFAAFQKCTNLKLTRLPNNVTKIGAYAFKCCRKLQLNELPNNVTKIGAYAFYNTNIESIDIPASVTKLGVDSFFTPSIKAITKADNSKLAIDDLIRACGRYFRQTNLTQYLKSPVFRQIEKDEIIDEPCPICCCDLEFNADDDNDNNIVDLPYAENHHYMHRDCYNEIQEELEEEIKNEKRELLIHRKIANGISKDIAEKEAEKAIEELDKEIQEETLEGFMTFLAGKKRAPSNCS